MTDQRVTYLKTVLSAADCLAHLEQDQCVAWSFQLQRTRSTSPAGTRLRNSDTILPSLHIRTGTKCCQSRRRSDAAPANMALRTLVPC